MISSYLCAYRFHSHRVTACELGDFPAFAGQIRRAQKGRCTSQQFGSSLCQGLSETLTGDMTFGHWTFSFLFQKNHPNTPRSWICASAPCIPSRAASWQTRSATARRRDSGGRRWGEMKRGKGWKKAFSRFCFAFLVCWPI